jgi:linoleoyl-CoA desaturase
MMPVSEPSNTVDIARKLTFGKHPEFQAALRQRVDDYFRTTGMRQRDCPQMYLKTAILLTLFAGSYILLVFVVQTWWVALFPAILLGFSAAGIGFNVQHDGGHHAYSNYAWVNKLMAMTLDLMGGSSYLWHWKHAVLHHTYVNINHHDTDIDLGVLGRLSPDQKRRSFHRWQHLYLWPLYGMLAIKWHLYDDFKDMLLGKIGTHKVPRPRGWDLVVFIGGKVTFLSLAFVIPLLVHSVGAVLLFYVVTDLVLGIALSIVFQLAHCVEGADFPIPKDERIENAWAIHQVQTTVDFSRKSRVAAWLFGGLNFQIEHHLFPRICHVNYPAISKLVEETCREYGVRFSENLTFWGGLASHYRYLRQMGTA